MPTIVPLAHDADFVSLKTDLSLDRVRCSNADIYPRRMGWNGGSLVLHDALSSPSSVLSDFPYTVVSRLGCASRPSNATEGETSVIGFDYGRLLGPQ